MMKFNWSFALMLLPHITCIKFANGAVRSVSYMKCHPLLPGVEMYRMAAPGRVACMLEGLHLAMHDAITYNKTTHKCLFFTGSEKSQSGSAAMWLSSVSYTDTFHGSDTVDRSKSDGSNNFMMIPRPYDVITKKTSLIRYHVFTRQGGVIRCHLLRPAAGQPMNYVVINTTPISAPTAGYYVATPLVPVITEAGDVIAFTKAGPCKVTYDTGGCPVGDQAYHSQGVGQVQDGQTLTFTTVGCRHYSLKVTLREY